MKHSEVLSRYVNTGQRIPEEQYDRLTPVLKKSYLRMRGVAGDYFEWEFKVISDNERIKYIEKYGEELDINYLRYLISLSSNKDNIITKIIDVRVEKLDSNDIWGLLYSSDNKHDIVTKIIDVKGKKLDSREIIPLVVVLKENKYDTTPSILKIIDVKGDNLDEHDTHILLKYSVNKDDIAIKIINIKGEKIHYDEIYSLLEHSNNKELIKKLLLQNGIDYILINDVITNDDIDTPLIPDNYQEMLNEIKRIKEIMK
jgi:hypothetical protein